MKNLEADATRALLMLVDLTQGGTGRQKYLLQFANTQSSNDEENKGSEEGEGRTEDEEIEEIEGGNGDEECEETEGGKEDRESEGDDEEEKNEENEDVGEDKESEEVEEEEEKEEFLQLLFKTEAEKSSNQFQGSNESVAYHSDLEMSKKMSTWPTVIHVHAQVTTKGIRCDRGSSKEWWLANTNARGGNTAVLGSDIAPIRFPC